MHNKTANIDALNQCLYAS